MVLHVGDISLKDEVLFSHGAIPCGLFGKLHLTPLQLRTKRGILSDLCHHHHRHHHLHQHALSDNEPRP